MKLFSKTISTYFVLVFTMMLLQWAISYLFITEELFQMSFQDQISSIRLNDFFEMTKKWEWLGFIILPVVILMRIFYTSICLYVGFVFNNVKISLVRIFKISVIADFIYVISGFIKLVILIFYKEISTIEDLQFTPLSVMEILKGETVDNLFIYPLSLLNIFELGYFLVLAWLLAEVMKDTNSMRFTFGKSLRLVTVSYGSGVLLWILVVMFITLNIS